MTVLRPLFQAVLLVAGLAGGPAHSASVYVASQEAGTLATIGVPDRAGVATIAVGPGPAVVAAGGGRLYVTHPDHGTITVVDVRSSEVLRRLPFRGQAFGIAPAGDGASLFVGDWQAGRVLRLCAENGTIEGSVAVGKDPAGLVLDRRGLLYVADRESRQVSVIDTAAMVRIATVPAGEAPFALALSPAQDRLYVANVRSNDITVIDTRALRPLATIPVGVAPYGVAVSEDGRLVLIANQQSGTVSILDAVSLGLLATITVGRYPEGIVVSGSRAYVANWFSDDVSVIDLAGRGEIARIAVGAGPRSLAVAQAGGTVP